MLPTAKANRPAPRARDARRPGRSLRARARHPSARAIPRAPTSGFWRSGRTCPLRQVKSVRQVPSRTTAHTGRRIPRSRCLQRVPGAAISLLSICRTTEVKSAFHHPLLTERRAFTLRLGSRWVFRRPEQGDGVDFAGDRIGATAVAVMRVPGCGACDDRQCPYDEEDEVTAGPPRLVDAAPTATILVVCATGRGPMATVSVEVAAWYDQCCPALLRALRFRPLTLT